MHPGHVSPSSCALLDTWVKEKSVTARARFRIRFIVVLGCLVEIRIDSDLRIEMKPSGLTGTAERPPRARF